MSAESPPATPSRFDLTQLASVPLEPARRDRLEVAARASGGPRPWHQRKLAEAHDLFALEQISRRLRVVMLDLAADFRAVLELRTAVPCLPDPAKPLVVERAALLGLTYRWEAVCQPQPGYSFVQVLMPRAVWHPNISFDANAVLCLRPVLPAAIPIKEILLLVYGALNLSAVTLDPADAAGTLNPASAEWWMRNTSLIPLSREPFLAPPSEHR